MIKLNINKAQLAADAAIQAADMLTQITKAEHIAPVNVHSHGQMLQQAIVELESALELARQFQIKMQGR